MPQRYMSKYDRIVIKASSTPVQLNTTNDPPIALQWCQYQLQELSAMILLWILWPSILFSGACFPYRNICLVTVYFSVLIFVLLLVMNGNFDFKSHQKHVKFINEMNYWKNTAQLQIYIPHSASALIATSNRSPNVSRWLLALSWQ